MVSSYLHNTQSKRSWKETTNLQNGRYFQILSVIYFSSLSLSVTHTHVLSQSDGPKTLFLPFFLSNNNNNPQRRRGWPPEVMKIAWWCNSSWILSNIFFQWLQPLSWKTFQGQVDQKTGLDFFFGSEGFTQSRVASLSPGELWATFKVIS